MSYGKYRQLELNIFLPKDEQKCLLLIRFVHELYLNSKMLKISQQFLDKLKPTYNYINF